MEQNGIRENPGFRPDGLHPGYDIFVKILPGAAHETG